MKSTNEWYGKIATRVISIQILSYSEKSSTKSYPPL